MNFYLLHAFKSGEVSLQISFSQNGNTGLTMDK